MSLIRVFVVLQLSMLLMSLTTNTLVSGLPLPHVPVVAPVVAPAMAPVAVPMPSPTIPKLPIRLPVAVQGVVFCKPCKYAGKETLQEATPLVGAIVKMACDNAKDPKLPIMTVATTDKNGYFFFQPSKKVSSYGAQKRCRVFLNLPPAGSNCTKPTHLNWGLSGAYLKPTKPSTPVNFALYTVGPFAYEPVCSHEHP